MHKNYGRAGVTELSNYRSGFLLGTAGAAKKQMSQAFDLILFFGIVVITLLIATQAHAAASATSGVASACNMTVSGATGADPICNIMLNINSLFKGWGGALLATIALACLGIMGMFGKLSWTQAGVLVIGMALLFGASNIIVILGAGQTATQSGSDPISNVFSTLTNQVTSTTGKAVGIIAIAIIGIGALMGKVSWMQALILAIGIALIFGALSLVNTFKYATASGETCATTTTTTTTASVSGDPCLAFYNIVYAMTGEMGVSIATLGITMLGFMAMLGKVSWVRALLLASGIALIFAAGNVVALLSGPLSPCTINTTSDPFAKVICGFMEELQGPMGKTIATLAIIVVGILAMLGKISWELGFVVTVGIALIFGANAIVELFEKSLVGVTCGTNAPSAPSTGNAIADVLCYIILILYGPAGKALACVAVIMMGFGALMGKVSYSQAFIVAAGIAVTFGAPAIVKIVLPSANTTGCVINPSNNTSTTNGKC